MIMQTSTSQNHTLGAYNLNIYFFSFKIYSKPTDLFLGIFEHTMNLKTNVKASLTVFDLNSLPIYIDSFSQRLLEMLWAQYAHNKFTIQSVPRVSHIVHFTVTEQKMRREIEIGALPTVSLILVVVLDILLHLPFD